jgi:glycine betaine catabolism A
MSPTRDPGQDGSGLRNQFASGSPRCTPRGEIYEDPNIFSAELERFFYRNWLCVGRSEDFTNSGDFNTQQIGRESVLLVRDGTGCVRGYYNLCRHRGTRVVSEPSGHGARSFACPYHAWSYDLDGRLIGAPHMAEQKGFDRRDYGLHPIRVDTWGGFVWVNLEADTPGLSDSLGTFFQRFDRFPLADLRLGGRQSYEVEANWKIIVENFSECYHCAPVHPSLTRLTPYLSGHNDASFLRGDAESKFSGGYMEFAQDFQSMTRSGYTKRPFVPGMTAEDRRRVYYYVLFPNMFFSLHPDYLMVHRGWPKTYNRTQVENEFYFTSGAMADPGFDPSDAMGLWDEINRQDWKVCELAQLGMGSRAWKGGRYSDREELVRDFDEYVAREFGRETIPRSGSE